MRKRGFLFVAFFLLLLYGCSNVSNWNPFVAQMTVANMFYEHPYLFSIVQTKGAFIGIGKKTSYLGNFDLTVRNNQGLEVSRKSLNQYFGNKDLTLDSGGVKLTVHDYNNDHLLDIPLGFPAGDGEYKYVIFSIDRDGKLVPLSAKGHKDDGFIYTAGGTCSPEFTQTTGTGEQQKPGLLVGVAGEGGSFTPAMYVWDGQQFVFEKENPFIITQSKLVDHGQKYSIKLVQTEYQKPLTPDDQGFSIAESMYRGRFDLLVQDSSGKETGRISLNQYFGNDVLGFGGSFPLVFGDYNRDGNDDFAVGRPTKDSPDFQYVLFTVNSKGGLSALPVGSGYKEAGFVYNAESGSSTGFPMLKNGEPGFSVTLSGLKNTGYGEGKYVWDGNKFVFSQLELSGKRTES